MKFPRLFGPDSLGGQPGRKRARIRSRPETTWPGLTRAGTVLLPNGWSLKPAGRQTRLGDFPVQIAVHPSEPVLAILHAGYGEHEVVTASPRPARSSAGSPCPRPSPVWSGRPTASGSSSAAGSTTDLSLRPRRRSAVEQDDRSPHPEAEKSSRQVPGGLALSADGKTLWVANAFGHSLARLDADRGRGPTTIPWRPIPTPTAWPGTSRASGFTSASGTRRPSRWSIPRRSQVAGHVDDRRSIPTRCSWPAAARCSTSPTPTATR